MNWKQPNLSKHNQDKDTNSQKQKATVDGGWAWLVAFCSCFGVSIATSLISLMGILYTAMLDELPYDFTSLTVIGSTHTALAAAGAVFAVPVVDRFGVRPVLFASGIVMFAGCILSAFVTNYLLLILCLGVIPGFASSFAYITFFIGANGYFDKKKAIGMSIVSSGNSISFVIFPQIITLIIDSYGYRGSLIIFSGIILNICVCGALILPFRQIESTPNHSATSPQVTDFSFLKRLNFIIVLITNVMVLIGIYLPFGFLPETIQSKGLSSSVLNVVFVVIGICQILGRVLLGFCSRRRPIYLVFIWIVYVICTGLSFLMVPFCTEMIHFVLFSCVSGIFMGGTLVGTVLSVRNLVEDKYFGRAMSFVLLAQGLGCLIGSPVAAFLQDITGDTSTPFFFGCGALVFGGLIITPFWRVNVQMKTEIVLDVEKNNYKLYHLSMETKEQTNIVYERDFGMHEIPYT